MIPALPGANYRFTSGTATTMCANAQDKQPVIAVDVYVYDAEVKVAAPDFDGRESPFVYLPFGGVNDNNPPTWQRWYLNPSPAPV